MDRLFRLIRRVWASVSKVEPYLDEIAQVVAFVAEMTPNRTDDQIARAAERLGVAVRKDGRTVEEVLAALVLDWAMQRWPGAPMRRLRRAIEIAYGMLKP